MNVQAIELIIHLQKYIYMDFLLFWIEESIWEVYKNIFESLCTLTISACVRLGHRYLEKLKFNNFVLVK